MTNAVDKDFVWIQSGSYRAAIDPYGGGLARAQYDGVEFVNTYALPRPHCSGMLLAPWPNRVGDARYYHDGEVFELVISEPERGNANHGFVGFERWDVSRAEEDKCTLRLSMPAQKGYPWPFEYEITWSVSANEGVSASFSATNLSDVTVPFGFGFHPYLIAPGSATDESILQLPVRQMLPLDPVRNLPAGPLVAVEKVCTDVGTLANISDGVALNGLWLDNCFTNVISDDGKVRAHVVGHDGQRTQVWAGEWCRWLQVFTAGPGRAEPYPGYGRAVAIEPMSCPPNAFRTGIDCEYLRGGEIREYQFGCKILAN
ncbi:aldose epimerase family protein [Arcanobacterium canis]